MKRNRLLNIVIFYDNYIEVTDYARALSKQKNSDLITLIIVINKAGQTTYLELEKEMNSINLDVVIFDPQKNLGYLNGLTFGYRKYIENFEVDNSCWVVFSNTDIKYEKDDFFEVFLSKVYDKNVWCVAPSVYSIANNSYSNPHYKKRFTLGDIKKRVFIFSRPTFAYYYLKLAEMKAKIRKKNKEESQYVFAAHGCYFIIKSELADILSETDYGSLMYSEEFYVAEIVRKYKKKIFYDSSIEVQHEESTTTSKIGIKKKSTYFADSLRLIAREFYGE